MIIWINNNNEEFFIQKNSHLEKQLPFFHSISLHIKVLRRKKITINYLLTTMIIETKTKDHRNILFKDILSWNILLNVSHDPFVTFEKKKRSPTALNTSCKASVVKARLQKMADKWHTDFTVQHQ